MSYDDECQRLVTVQDLHARGWEWSEVQERCLICPTDFGGTGGGMVWAHLSEDGHTISKFEFNWDGGNGYTCSLPAMPIALLWWLDECVGGLAFEATR